MLAIIYLNVFYLIGKYYKTKKYVTYFVILGLLVTLYVYSATRMNMYISAIMNYNEAISGTIFWYFFDICRYCVVAFLLFSLQEKFDQKKQMDQIKVEKLNTEINYLRAQINPHFLFNTLNNLYALALERSDKTPEIIIKLSRMMDFMLYELDGTKVPLSKDVENLENYIDMERIRQGNNAVIVFRKEGNISDQKIEPLLMLPLVENAFKHGVNQLIEGSYLEIILESFPMEIRFSVKNNYKGYADHNKQVHSSLGLSNLQRRLDLFYPGKHKLKVYDDNRNYHVNLTVSL